VQDTAITQSAPARLLPGSISSVRIVRQTIMAAGLAALAGCTTLADGSRWGANANLRPGWDRVEEAALHAAKNPWVWAPLAGAAMMQIDDWDHKVSRWAVDNTPLFGSVTSAETASDDLEIAAGVGYIASVMATPGGDAGIEWGSAKLRGGLVGLAAIGAASATTEGLRALAKRTRPNGGDGSFPSGHTSFTAAADTMTRRNLESMAMNDGARRTLMIGTDVLTIATGLARVEAGAHYPSDVMAGMAIGNFFSVMFADAFLGDGLGDRVSLAVEPIHDGGEFVWNFRF
jgi:membrane-associated phospholipid phosphatase